MSYKTLLVFLKEIRNVTQGRKMTLHELSKSYQQIQSKCYVTLLNRNNKEKILNNIVYGKYMIVDCHHKLLHRLDLHYI